MAGHRNVSGHADGAQVRGLIEARRLAGSEFQTQTDFPLISASLVRVARIESSPTSAEYVACMDAALTKSALITLLRIVAPYKLSGFDDLILYGVIADWRLPEIAGAGRINNLHASGLGEHWKTFEQNRRLLVNTLTTDDPLQILSGKHPIQTLRILKDPSTDFLNHGIYLGTKNLITFFGRPGISDVLEEIVGLLKKTRDCKISHRMKRAPADEAIRLFSQFSKKTRAKCLRAAFKKVSLSTQDRIVQEYADFASTEPHTTVVTLPDGKHVVVQFEKGLNSLPEQTAAAYSGRTISVSNGLFLLEGTANIMEGKKIHYAMSLDTLRSKYFVMPFIHWTSHLGGERTFHYDFVEWRKLPPEINELLDRRAIGREEVDPRLNPLTGLLAVAYFSPEIIGKWPMHVGLPGSKSHQVMGPAQVPVLAMMQHRSLLRSSFLTNLERYADTGTL